MKQQSRMVDLNPVLLIVLNVNILNSAIKMQILSDWVKKKAKFVYVSYKKFILSITM